MEKIHINNSGYEIVPAKIVSTRKMTEQEKIFELKLVHGLSLDHEPGQFVEVSILGVGEAPISVCSSPTKRDSFEICVRAVKDGRFSNAMHNLDIGDEVGIRGPFGVGFPAAKLEGYDIIMVAGGLGIAPLRSLINYIIDNRREYGKVSLLLGCKDPQSMLFADEIDLWQKRVDINFSCTVDRGAPDWKGNVGLITSLIPNVNIDPERTYAVVVGPPVMYKFVIKELLSKGIPEHQILVSLERHMKCGLGKCGHCQIHNIYCCQDGPVFSYNNIKELKGAI
ncbi:MAG: oxidoreductase [Spirochaetes bacterium GWB1_27_13]|nr:MAG: oxidoreductase [Spirochaetes bacterium GWB1_27_13]